MQETFTDEYGHRMTHRERCNTHGQLHRTPGPAVVEWTVLTGGARGAAASFPAWSRDARVAMTDAAGAMSSYGLTLSPTTYRSAVGGSVLLCV